MLAVRRIAPLLALLLTAPLAGAHGPYTGTVATGETDTYPIDHGSPICLDVITDWVVTLSYLPATDTLMLSVPGHGSAVGVNGSAKVAFQTPDSCAVFDVRVTGTLVASVAAYRVELNR